MRKIKRLQTDALPFSRIKRYSSYCKSGPDFQKRILTGILLIETFYRPFYYRIGEYSITLISCCWSLLFKKNIKSYTIGIGQIGIARILNLCEYEFDPRQHYVQIRSLAQLICVISTLRRSKMVRLLEQYISQLITHAKETIPNNKEEQILYVGELYNGRYSYGLLLVEVFNNICLSK